MNSRVRKTTKRSLLWIVLLVITIGSVLPIVWMALGSFKTQAQMFARPPVILPPKLFLGNYLSILRGNDSLIPFLVNSLIISATTTAIVMFLATLAGYGLARMNVRGSQHLEFWILSTRMMPPIAVLIPIMLIVRRLGLFDTLPGVILPYVAFNLPYAVWMLIIFFRQLPAELEEAALLDGCGWGKALRRIVIPLALPSLMTVATLVFIFSWNELLFALILTGHAAKTFPVALSSYAGGIYIRWQLMTAATVLQAIPAVIVVVVLQRYIVSGLTLGGVER